MPSTGSTRGPIAIGAILAICSVRPSLLAQADVRVLAGDVTDARYSGGDRAGGLSLKVKVRGDGMDGVEAFRFLLAEARDDLGNSILPEKRDPPAFRDVRGDRAEESLSLRNPAREASSFSVSGRVELFVPGRDPDAVVKVARALARPDRPLSSPGLTAAHVKLTVLPRAGRPQEIVSLRGRTVDFDGIRSIRILRSDGAEIRVVARSWWSDSGETVMTLEASEPVPENASLVFALLTSRSRVSVPFELKEIPLP
jgi:hypothetical protein